MFKHVDVTTLPDNFIRAISEEWMLITAGDEKAYNMMTASWGFVGQMWGKRCAVAAIRPNRYTKEFVDKCDTFTLSFYGDEAKKTIHSVCGNQSGRDIDKAAACGLTPVFSDGGVYFDNARLVLVCKKLYTSKMDPEKIIDKSIEKWYDNDYHEFYIGEITACYVNE